SSLSEGEEGEQLSNPNYTVIEGEIERQILGDSEYMARFFTWTHPSTLQYVKFVYQTEFKDHENSTFGDAILAVCKQVAELRSSLLNWSKLNADERAEICKKHYTLSQVMKPIWEHKL